MRDLKTAILSFGFLLTFGVARTNAAVLITSSNLDSFELGPAIIGPLGPEVPGTFVTNDSIDIGNLRSSVFCPFGTEQADCPSASVETYIYRHIVTPSTNDVTSFTADFPVNGFTGVAGYSFTESGAVGGNGNNTDFNIVFNDDSDETLVWSLAAGSDRFFDSGETITFFWQSTNSPAGPIGSYRINNAVTGTAIGPAPSSTTSTTSVPEPSKWGFLALFVIFLSRLKSDLRSSQEQIV